MLMSMGGCKSIVSHGSSTSLLYQCKSENAIVVARKTKCGHEPMYNGMSLSLDDHTSLSPFITCLHDRTFTQIHDVVYEYSASNDSWRTVSSSIKIDHIHLASLFKITPDTVATNSFINMHELPDRSYMDILSEISAVMDTRGVSSVGLILQDHSSHNNAIDVVSIFTT